MARAFLTPSCSIVDREPIPFRDSIGNHSITPVAKPLLDLANHKNRHVSAETSAFFSVNRRCGLCYVRNRKVNIDWRGGGEGVKCLQDAQNSNFTAKCLKTFVAH